MQARKCPAAKKWSYSWGRNCACGRLGVIDDAAKQIDANQRPGVDVLTTPTGDAIGGAVLGNLTLLGMAGNDPKDDSDKFLKKARASYPEPFYFIAEGATRGFEYDSVTLRPILEDLDELSAYWSEGLGTTIVNAGNGIKSAVTNGSIRCKAY